MRKDASDFILNYGVELAERVVSFGMGDWYSYETSSHYLKDNGYCVNKKHLRRAIKQYKTIVELELRLNKLKRDFKEQ